MRKLVLGLCIIFSCSMFFSGIAFQYDATIAPGPTQALNELESEVKALTTSAFKNPKSSANQKQTILKQIKDVYSLIQKGNFKSAVNKLDKDIKSKINTWIVSSNQSVLIKSINTGVISIENASKTTVNTSFGKVSGVDGGHGSWKWAGIPYAKPPVGELRWKAPVDPEPWTGIRFSTTDFSRCTQPVTNLQWVPQNKLQGSEDCLYLNIFRPKTASKNLPVFFWIHGGGNVMGGADEYDLSYFANKANMVVVVIQYRLGPFGWFYNPALNPNGTSEEKSGNYANLDMIKALKWVQKNIVNFGGNPNNVTIAGESAGGFQVLNLMISPLAKGLFHKAISQSAAGSNAPIQAAASVSASAIERLLVMDGTCEDLTEAASYSKTMTNAQIENYLMSKSAEDIAKSVMNEAGGITSISSIADGYVLPDTMSEALKSGNYNKIPVIIGCNGNEMKPFFPLYFGTIPTSTGYSWANIYNVLGLEQPSITLNELLPENSPDRQLFDTVTNYSSDYWKAALNGYTRIIKEHQDDVYSYWFKWGGEGSAPSPFDYLFGSGHSFEMDFFFGFNDKSLGNIAFVDENKHGREALHNAMAAYLKAFAESGNPNLNNSNLPTWEKWSNAADAPKSIVFDADYNNSKINMSNIEYSRAEIEEAVNNLPSPVKEMTYALMWYYYIW
ncbi:carboxylesterase/lipase family protein [Ruminiclostridium herbifermentans]|nr:carboxylesterase family protein [Ruminiclostridium herbifermentans]